LHLTEGTIKEYLNRIYRKLEMTNRTELAIWALTRQSEPTDQTLPGQVRPLNPLR
jgi:hypothetical protein